MPVSVLVSRDNNTPVVTCLMLLSHTRAPHHLWFSQYHTISRSCLPCNSVICHGSNETEHNLTFHILSSFIMFSHLFHSSRFSLNHPSRGKCGRNSYQLVQTCIVYLCIILIHVISKSNKSVVILPQNKLKSIVCYYGLLT